MGEKILKIVLCIICLCVLIVSGYVIYAFAAYYRLDDNLPIDIVQTGITPDKNIENGKSYRIVSHNVGFGAYSDDYSFFMDGGKESRAFSKTEVVKNITGSLEKISSLEPDFILIQEVDVKATRSYKVHEGELALSILQKKGLNSINYSYAQNFDSPYLFYPLTNPHGKSIAGIYTITQAPISKAIRRSLPIDSGVTKMLDLDRCYSKSYIRVNSGKELVIYNVHLSAYNKNPATAENQIIMLNADMKEEYEKGNYIIAGGDMNKDLLGDSASIFKKGTIAANWAAPFPEDLLDSAFKLVAPFNPEKPIPSCRNADIPYSDKNFVLTVDGFIVSENIQVIESDVASMEFKYSDHNPVYMDFILKSPK